MLCLFINSSYFQKNNVHATKLRKSYGPYRIIRYKHASEPEDVTAESVPSSILTPAPTRIRMKESKKSAKSSIPTITVSVPSLAPSLEVDDESSEPTNVPSIVVTQVPSTMSSSAPTLSPSSVKESSASPSISILSGDPTVESSNSPSISISTEIPTAESSNSPSISISTEIPTAERSNSPSISISSGIPTFAPSKVYNIVTNAPSLSSSSYKPSITYEIPSQSQSGAPSFNSSNRPSIRKSAIPTLRTSLDPTASVTASPTGLFPSSTPTFSSNGETYYARGEPKLTMDGIFLIESDETIAFLSDLVAVFIKDYLVQTLDGKSTDVNKLSVTCDLNSQDPSTHAHHSNPNGRRLQGPVTFEFDTWVLHYKNPKTGNSLNDGDFDIQGVFTSAEIQSAFIDALLDSNLNEFETVMGISAPIDGDSSLSSDAFSENVVDESESDTSTDVSLIAILSVCSGTLLLLALFVFRKMSSSSKGSQQLYVDVEGDECPSLGNSPTRTQSEKGSPFSQQSKSTTHSSPKTSHRKLSNEADFNILDEMGTPVKVDQVPQFNPLVSVSSERPKTPSDEVIEYPFDERGVEATIQRSINYEDNTRIDENIKSASLECSGVDEEDTLYNGDPSIVSKLSAHGYSTLIYGDAATVATDLNTLTDARNIIQKMEVSMKTESTMKNVDVMLTDREEYIEVVAPAGMLGVMTDSSRPGPPVVGAIHEDSPLADSLQPGDRIVKIDEVDTSEMSSVNLNELVSSRRESSRTLGVLRTRSMITC